MENKLNLDEIEKLPAKERALLKKRHALHCKYEKAVTLYADTTLSTRIIALRCGVTPGALGKITYAVTGGNWFCNGIRYQWKVKTCSRLKSIQPGNKTVCLTKDTKQQ